MTTRNKKREETYPENGTVILSLPLHRLVVLTLAAYRKREKLNQTEFSKMIGYSQAAWSKVENGQVNMPLSRYVEAIESLGIKDAIEIAREVGRRLEQRGVRVFSIPPGGNYYPPPRKLVSEVISEVLGAEVDSH